MGKRLKTVLVITYAPVGFAQKELAKKTEMKKKEETNCTLRKKRGREREIDRKRGELAAMFCLRGSTS